ncbi:MAG: GH92 family glycosyl hydrolase [Bacteroidetes bacterium]|nr:GH92 family glycosyl hydrolase [Bacteroidota bacterium]
MKRLLSLCLAATLMSHAPALAQRRSDLRIKEAFSTSVLDYVNPLVGTQKMGHTFPGACFPFGGVQLSPDTEMVPYSVNGAYQPEAYEYCAGYQYDDPTIVGFSHTHFSGTGHSDLGDILIMPAIGPLRLDRGSADAPETGYRSRFSHERETASPGYYSVVLDDYGIKAELTATPRAGIHRYTFPQGEGRIIVDLTHGIYHYEGKVLWANLRVENDTTLTGYRITRGWARTNYTYFAIRLSKPIQHYGHRNNEQVTYNGFWRRFKVGENFPEMGGTQITAFFEFDFEEGEALECKVALSAVDALGALKNLEAETSGSSFDQLLVRTRNAWEKELSVFDIQAPQDQKCVFYTSLYHALIHPSLYMDVDGRYRGIDHNIHQAEGFTNYTIFSFWDTHRAEHPLMNLIHPQKSRDFAASMLAHYRQSVHKALPVWAHKGNENWCMIGYHGVSVLADAWAKGVLTPQDVSPDLLLEAMINSSNIPYYDGSAEYVQLGYVPLEVTGNAASVTLENAYDDWCIARFAQSTGRDDIAASYHQRAQSYKNIFDPALGFARPRYRDGRWKDDFDLLDTHGQGFIEGNAWNYSFFAPHDVPGLIERMGGKAIFEARLDSLFTMELPDKYFEHTEDITREGLMGNYVHGNEPSHHVPYLYAWTDHPSKGQARIRAIMDQMYQNKIDGLCGNDDCGQMSAWYIFSAMGFYPVCPGSDQYVIGTPYFSKMSLKLENGKELTIVAHNLSSKNSYIHSVKLNGQPVQGPFLHHKDMVEGGILEFEMGPGV